MRSSSTCAVAAVRRSEEQQSINFDDAQQTGIMLSTCTCDTMYSYAGGACQRQTHLDRDQDNKGDDDAKHQSLLPVANTEVQQFGEEASVVCWLHALHYP